LLNKKMWLALSTSAAAAFAAAIGVHRCRCRSARYEEVDERAYFSPQPRWTTVYEDRPSQRREQQSK